MLEIIKDNKKFIIISNSIIIIIGLITCFILPKKYTAEAIFIKNLSRDFMTSSTLEGMLLSSSQRNGDINVYNILSTRWIMDRVIEKENLKEYYKIKFPEEAYASYLDNMKLDDKKDGMYILYYTDKDPEKAASICNTILKELKNFYTYKDSVQAEGYINFIQNTINELNQEIIALTDSISKIYQETGISLTPNTTMNTLSQSPMEALRDSIFNKYLNYKYYEYKNPNSSITKQYKEELDILYKEWEALYKKGITTRKNITIMGPQKESPFLITHLIYLNSKLETKLFVYSLLYKEYYSNLFKKKKKNTDIQIIDYAVPPNKRSFPKRKLILMGFIFIAIILDTLYIHYKLGQIKTT